MTILVTYASKHSATRAIAERIAGTLREQGLAADVAAVEQVADVTRYDGFVIGSAVYYGSWLKPAVEFVRRHRATLAEQPVWLFSSGPLGADDPMPAQTPKQIAEIERLIRPREHRIFAGKLDADSLSFLERTVVKGVKAPYGDFRQWDELDAWAASIARALRIQPASATR